MKGGHTEKEALYEMWMVKDMHVYAEEVLLDSEIIMLTALEVSTINKFKREFQNDLHCLIEMI